MIKIDGNAKDKKIQVEGTGVTILNDLGNALEAVLCLFAELGEDEYDHALVLIENLLDEICAKIEEKYGFIDKPDDDEEGEDEEDKNVSLSSDEAELFIKLVKAVFETNHPDKKKEEK